jgi:hypothetical protein
MAHSWVVMGDLKQFSAQVLTWRDYYFAVSIPGSEVVGVVFGKDSI